MRNAIIQRRYRLWPRIVRTVPARLPVASKESREWDREIAAMERVLQEIAERLHDTSETLARNLRRMDEALASAAEEKRQTEVLLRELGIGR